MNALLVTQFWLKYSSAINWLAGLCSLAVLVGSLALLTTCLHGAEFAPRDAEWTMPHAAPDAASARVLAGHDR